MNCLKELYLRIEPSRFNYLKNILEGYDGLAMLSSHDIREGIVRIRYPEQRDGVLFPLLQAISGQITRI